MHGHKNIKISSQFGMQEDKLSSSTPVFYYTADTAVQLTAAFRRMPKALFTRSGFRSAGK